MRSSTFVWIGLIAIVLIAGLLLFQNTRDMTQTGIGGGPAQSGIPFISRENRADVLLSALNLNEINQFGKATLVEKDGQVEVTIDVNKVDGLNNQPAHIHAGSCPDVGDIIFPLNDVVDGRSVTLINATIDQLRESPMAVNVHKSAEEISVSTSCGNI